MPLGGVQAAPTDLHAVAGLIDREFQAGLARLDVKVVRGHMRVGQHQVVVERAPDAQGPAPHHHRLARLTFAVEHLENG